MSSFLTQEEADALLALDKHYVGSEQFEYPGLGGALHIPLQSGDARESFHLDVRRGRINLSKNTFQTRVRRAVVLARVDLGGSPHVNPDGEELSGPHLHLYREGYDDKWAVPLPDMFTNPSDAWHTLDMFMTWCNVTAKPDISRDLFT